MHTKSAHNVFTPVTIKSHNTTLIYFFTFCKRVSYQVFSREGDAQPCLMREKQFHGSRHLEANGRGFYQSSTPCSARAS